MANHFEYVIEEIASPESLAKNLKERLPKILETLESDSQSSYFLQILTTLLGPVLNHLDVQVYEKEVLQYVLPCVQDIFEKNLNEIANSLENSLEDSEEEVSITLSKLLQVCLDILLGYGELLDNLLSKRSVNAEHVESLNKTLPPVLLKAFTHCKDSELIYGGYFADSATILSAFFKKSYEVQTKYYKTLEEKINFYTSYEDDLNVMNKVLDTICLIGEIVIELDIKSSVDTWKPYCKLAHKYVNDLKNRLDVSKPIAIMCRNIKHIINLLTDQEDPIIEPKRGKLLKIGGFILKIIIRLCETYKNYLGECLDVLLDLLLLLLSCSKDETLTVSVRDELERFITVGASSLLFSLIEEDDFLKSFASVQEKLNTLPLETRQGFLFLVILLEGRLAQSNKAFQEKWSQFNLVEIVVDTYNCCGLEIDFSMGFEGETVYSKLISSSASYIICTFNKTTFPPLERYLVQKLFHPRTYTSLFVSDLICTFCRCSNMQICVDLVLYLCDLLISWPEEKKQMPQYIIVGLTAGRLFRMIPKAHSSIYTKYPFEKNLSLWYWLGLSDLPALNKAQVTLNDKFNHLQHIQTLSSYFEFVQLLKFQYLFESFDKSHQILNGIIQCLHNYKDISKQDEKRSSLPWLDEIFNSLLNFSVHYLCELSKESSKTYNQQLSKITSLLKEILKETNTNASCKLSICAFLKKSSYLHIALDEYRSTACDGLSKMFVQLLKDEDIFIRQTAIESYVEFAHKSSLEDVIKSVLNNDTHLQDMVSCYIQGNVEKPALTFTAICEKVKGEFKHKCVKKKFNKTESADPPPAKKFKSNQEDISILMSLEKINAEVKNVKEILLKQGLTHEMKKLLDETLSEMQILNDLPVT